MDALYDFEGNFEIAAQAVVVSAGLVAYIQAVQSRMDLVYAGISFDAGAALDELIETPKPAGWGDDPPPQEYFHYDGTLDFRVSVPRDKNQAPNPDVESLMSFYRARIRNFFRLSCSPFTAINLPYYRVSSIRPQGGSHGYEAQRNLDFQNMRFAVRWQIAPDAWPIGGG